MRIAIKRLDAKRYSTQVSRDDGVVLRVPGYGFMRELPHDLEHFAVESAFPLPRGVWQSIAEGALFPGMVVLEGRQKPHARSRSLEILRAHGTYVSDAERIVAACCAALEGQPLLDSERVTAQVAQLVGKLHHPMATPGTADVSRVTAAWHELLARWREVAVGQALELSWALPTGRGSTLRSPRHQTLARLSAGNLVGAR